MKKGGCAFLHPPYYIVKYLCLPQQLHNHHNNPEYAIQNNTDIQEESFETASFRNDNFTCTNGKLFHIDQEKNNACQNYAENDNDIRSEQA